MYTDKHKNSKPQKFKNVGILYNILVKNSLNEILFNQNVKSSNKTNPFLNLINKHFTRNGELLKELKYYDILISPDKYHILLKENNISSFLEQAISHRENNIDKRKLKSEIFNLVRDIKQQHSLQKFGKTKISNYKELASINEIYSNHNNKSGNLENLWKNKQTIHNYLLNKCVDVKKDVLNKDVIFEEFAKQPKEIRNLAFRLLIENFNKKYEKTLTSSQLIILNKFITLNSEPKLLAEEMNKIIQQNENQLKGLTNFFKKNKFDIDNKVMEIKLQFLNESYKKDFVNNEKDGNKKIKQKNIELLMKYNGLIDEIKVFKQSKETLYKLIQNNDNK